MNQSAKKLDKPSLNKTKATDRTPANKAPSSRPAKKSAVKVLTSRDLREISKKDRDRPTLLIFFLIVFWFVFLRWLLAVPTNDYLFAAGKFAYDLFNAAYEQISGFADFVGSIF